MRLNGGGANGLESSRGRCCYRGKLLGAFISPPKQSPASQSPGYSQGGSVEGEVWKKYPEVLTAQIPKREGGGAQRIPRWRSLQGRSVHQPPLCFTAPFQVSGFTPRGRKRIQKMFYWSAPAMLLLTQLYGISLPSTCPFLTASNSLALLKQLGLGISGVCPPL